MANIQEKIAKLFPEATFEEGECLLVNIPDAKWHALAKTLKEDSELSYDYLVTAAEAFMDENRKDVSVYKKHSVACTTSLQPNTTPTYRCACQLPTVRSPCFTA